MASKAAAELWARYAASSAALQEALRALCSLHAKVARADGGDARWLDALERYGTADPTAWAATGKQLELGGELVGRELGKLSD